MAARKAAAARGVRWDTVRKLALSFPGMSEGTSYGEHAFLLDGKFFSRFNPKEHGLVIFVGDALREALLEGRPETYFTTDHYRGYPYVLARLERLPRAELAALYEAAFRAKAKRRRVAEYEARRRGAAPRAVGQGAAAREPSDASAHGRRGTSLARSSRSARRKNPR